MPRNVFDPLTGRLAYIRPLDEQPALMAPTLERTP